MYLDRARQLISELNPKLEKHFVGCSMAEVAELEEILGVSIPAAFKEFLLWFGRSGGNLMQGSSFYYDHIAGKAHPTAGEEWQGYTLKDDAIELLEEHGLDGKSILEHALVFMEHQGYIFEFIPTNQGDDPPVFCFQESGKPEENVVQPWAKSFSEYIEHLMETMGKPADSLRIFDVPELDNPYSYDDQIKKLSFNGRLKSSNGAIPTRIFDFVNLESLDLRYFQLNRMGPEISAFRKLRHLNLNSNQLTSLPRELFSLPHLESLLLVDNQLNQFPAAVLEHDSLLRIDLSRNPIPQKDIEAFRASCPGLDIVF